MGETFRALIVRTGGPGGGSVLHVVRDGDAASMCQAFKLEQLGTAGSFDDHLCPSCLDALQGLWRSRQRQVKTK